MMVTTSGEDYITLAEANGLRNRTIFFRFGLRNAMLPQLTALGLSLANVVAGQVIVEVIFAWPGIGSYAYRSATTLDLDAIVGVTIFVALIYIIVNFVIDVLYGTVDPRIRRA